MPRPAARAMPLPPMQPATMPKPGVSAPERRLEEQPILKAKGGEKAAKRAELFKAFGTAAKPVLKPLKPIAKEKVVLKTEEKPKKSKKKKEEWVTLEEVKPKQPKVKEKQKPKAPGVFEKLPKIKQEGIKKEKEDIFKKLSDIKTKK